MLRFQQVALGLFHNYFFIGFLGICLIFDGSGALYVSLVQMYLDQIMFRNYNDDKKIDDFVNRIYMYSLLNSLQSKDMY